MWGVRVWWGRSRVRTDSGATWNFTFDDTSGHRQYYKLSWTDKSIERVAMICEATPPGEPAALPYYDQQSHKESREAHANVEGVDFIQPSQVPTVARLARQAWESYQRSRASDPITR
jgi:hypothetical protein